MSRYRSLVVVIVLALVVSLAPAARPVVAQDTEPAAEFVPGQVVVGFPEGLSAEEYAAQASALAGEVSAQVLKQGRNLAVLQFAEDADVLALAAELSERGVIAEPNYIVRLPAPIVNHDRAAPEAVRFAEGEDENSAYVERLVSSLAQLRTRVGKKSVNTYPNDKSYWNNSAAWANIGAQLVWNNTTPQVNVCVIDTGVDYTHPDLSGRIIKGYDFVNADADPMDDNAHGTHVAGIITAKANNKLGMGGVSSTRVVAVKALDSIGSGTWFDINQAIYYCADRSDVKIINMSLGGPSSAFLQSAVNYAVNTRGKLLVAAAGNSATNSMAYAYPAAYAVTYPGRVIAVAASGDANGNYNCQASYTNYGSWTTIIAPGTYIYSTTPWDKPFFDNSYYGTYPRYDYLSGTSMAAPVVAAVAARAWGFLGSTSNQLVANYITDPAQTTAISTVCWDASMASKRQVNLAKVLQRGAFYFRGNEATTGLPLDGATVTLFRNGVAFASSKIVASPVTHYDGSTTYYYNNYVDFLNLPVGNYTARISKAGYSAPTDAFIYSNLTFTPLTSTVFGVLAQGGRAFVPRKSADTTTVAGSWPHPLNQGLWLPANGGGDPDSMVVTLNNPGMGWIGSGHPELVGSTTGSLTAFPFARVMHNDYWNEALVIKARPGAPNSVYYPNKASKYTLLVYLSGFPFNQNATVFIWRGGVLLARVDNQCTSGAYWKVAEFDNSLVTLYPSTCANGTTLWPY